MFLNQGEESDSCYPPAASGRRVSSIVSFSLISRDGESRLALAACCAEAQTQTPKAPSVRKIAQGAVPETLMTVEELAARGHARNGRPLAQSRCLSFGP